MNLSQQNSATCLLGNIATSLETENTIIGYYTSTVIVGNTKMYGFNEAVNLPISLEVVGTLHIILMVEM